MNKLELEDWQIRLRKLVVKLSPEGDTSGEVSNVKPELVPYIKLNAVERFIIGMKAEQKEEDCILRQMLWLRHGCEISALYGDDGELQCSECGVDFKRMPATNISEMFHDIGLARLKKMKETAISVFGLKEK